MGWFDDELNYKETRFVNKNSSKECPVAGSCAACMYNECFDLHDRFYLSCHKNKEDKIKYIIKNSKDSILEVFYSQEEMNSWIDNNSKSANKIDDICTYVLEP